MGFPKILHGINAIVLGYVITLSLMIFNYLDGDKPGTALALASFACAYFAELDYADGKRHPWATFFLHLATIIACAASAAYWLF